MPPAKLSISEVVNRVGAIYRDQARVLLPTALVIFLVAGAAGTLLASASTALLFVAFAVQLIAGTIYSGMVVALVADLREGRSDRRGAELLSAVGPVMGPLLAVAIITGVGVVVGTGLFVVPGLFLLTIWAVAAAVVMVERVGPFVALGRSQQLVRGNGWPVFGVILSVTLIVLVAGFVLQGFGSAGGLIGAIIGAAIGNTLTAPLAALAAAVVYFELHDLRDPGSVRAPGPSA